jgi:hypothetical protein
MGLMLRSMSVDDRARAEQWFDPLPASQAKAVLRALAGRDTCVLTASWARDRTRRWHCV